MHVFLILPLFVLINVGRSVEISVDGDKGHNSKACLNNCLSSKHCQSLEYIADNADNADNCNGNVQGNLTITIFSTVLKVSRLVNFTNMNSISIIGQRNGTTVTCNSSLHEVLHNGSVGSGIYFLRSINIKLKDFTIKNCLFKFSHAVHVRLQAIAIHDSTNVSITNVTFADNTGYGLALADVNGSMYISNCLFINNGVQQINDQNKALCKISVGGLFILSTRLFNASYQVFRTNFTNNANIINYTLCGIEANNKRGGGIQLVLVKSTNHNITVDGCIFRNNRAINGAGMYIEVGSDYTNSTLLVSKCIFDSNSVNKSGGGVDFGLVTRKVISSYNKLVFDQCHFKNNSASHGAAISLNRNASSWPRAGASMLVNIGGCRFYNNSAGVLLTHLSETIQSGVLFMRNVDVLLSGTNIFKYNINTALYDESADIIFEAESHTRFIGNIGERGGAMLLVGKARLSLHDSIYVTFKRNTAIYGGAVCVMKHQTQFTDTCFIKHNCSSCRFYFESNKAMSGMASDMFISSLKPCKRFCEKCNYKQLLKYLADFQLTINSSSVATAPSFLNISNTNISVFPGIPQHISVQQVDQFYNKILALYPLSAIPLNASPNIKLKINSTKFYNTITVVGDVNASGKIMLRTTALSNIQKTLTITLVDCPAGHYYHDKRCHCSGQDRARGFQGIPYCLHNYSAIIEIGYWAGFCHSGNFSTGACHASLCSYPHQSNYQGHYILPLSHKKTVLERQVCAKNRQGILCGRCIHNYSTLYRSPSFMCSNASCHYGMPLYVVSELVPVTVLFLLILLLDVRLTSGAFYTLIFYGQFLDNLFINAFGFIVTEQPLVTATFVYQSIYGVFNLQLFNTEETSFCVWSNATVMHLFMIKYITTVYAFLLIVFTVIILKVNSLYRCIKLCHQLGRRDIHGSIINALSAFLVLSYSQCIRITFSILNRVQLHSGDDFSGPMYVPLFDGELEYMKGEHLYFACPAILCLCIIIVPPFLLLIIEPPLIKISNMLPRWAAYMILQLRMKIKPFLDSFQGCFKDNSRIFAGMFFLYRIVLLLPSVFPGGAMIEYMTAELILFLILLCHFLVQPFQKKIHNQLDIFLLTNLLAVNTLTMINYSIQWNNSQLKRATILIQLFLITLPLLYIVGYLAYYIFKSIKSKISYRLSSMYTQESLTGIVEESLPARLLNENMLSLSYNSFADK